MNSKLTAILGTAALLYRWRRPTIPFPAEFDSTKPVTLEGTVVKMDFVNPHSWLYLDVKGPDGQSPALVGGGRRSRRPAAERLDQDHAA
jgi:hypothetical protein